MTASSPEFRGLQTAALPDDADLTAQLAKAYPPAGVANWALFVFALSLVVNFLDRGIINLLVQPIKRDLHLSDFRVSLLMGPAFVAFYLLLGLPIARLTDLRSRRAILGFGLGCWSVMTAACGVAQGFVSFFCARVGVGVGDACTGPATYSMLSDLFPRERLPRAMAFMQLGATVGLGLALLIGAAVIQAVAKAPNLVIPVLGVIHNWQLVFFIVGIPGLVVALLVTTVPEPQRRGIIGRATLTNLPVSQVIGFLRKNWKTYLPIFVALGLGAMNTAAAQSWGPTFYQRTFGWAPQKTAVLLGIGTITLTPVALLFGTLLVEWYHRRGFGDANIRLIRWTTLLALPFPILSPLSPTPELALSSYLVGVFILAVGTFAQNAALQTVTPNQMRGRVTALFLFFYSIGSGMGPTVVALLTDSVFRDESRVGQAMALAAACLLPLQVACYWLVLKPYARSVEQAKEWS
jgi:MFS family permease